MQQEASVTMVKLWKHLSGRKVVPLRADVWRQRTTCSPLHHVDSGGRSQATRLGSRHIYPLSSISSPTLAFLWTLRILQRKLSIG